MTTHDIQDLIGLSPEQLALLPQLLQAEGIDLSSPEPLPQIVPNRGDRYQPFPLNDMQQAYWIGRTDSFEIGNVSIHSYHEVEVLNLDIQRFNRAWQRLVNRHDMLRAVVLPDGQQQILPQVPDYQVQVVDLTGQPADPVAASLQAIRDRLSHQLFPLEQYPQYEIVATRLDVQRSRLHFSIDGWCLDGKSLQLLFHELKTLYDSPDVQLPRLELSFRDYVLATIALEQSDRYQRALAYWQRRLLTLPPAPELPLAKQPASLKLPRFASFRFSLEPQLFELLKQQAAKAGVTLASTLLTVYAKIMRLWGRSDRFTISVPRFNRLPLHPQVNQIMGELASFTLLEVDCSQPESFTALARRLQTQLWQDLEQDCVSGVRLLRELAKTQGGAGRVLMPIVFTTTPQDLEGAGDIPLGEVVYTLSKTPQVWIDNLYFVSRQGALIYTWQVVEELFPPDLIREMFDAACRLLQDLAEDEWAWQRVDASLIPPAQLHQRRNQPRAEIPDLLLHQLVAAQVAQRSPQLAVVSSRRSLTYGELWQRANQLGHRLRQLGAKPNRLVAIVMEKGWEQIVGVLGILTAGAAYLPIDAALPQERLWYLLEHGEVEIVLTQTSIASQRQWPSAVELICVDGPELDCQPDSELEPVQHPDDLLYVLYTSGSTGLPKGVMIAHRGAVNAIVQTNRQFNIGADDRLLALTALHHDMSVYDIFGTLAAGGTLVLPDASATRDPAHWLEWLVRAQITLWNSVPAMMEMLIAYSDGKPLPTALRWVFLGGDWISVTLPDRLKALGSRAQVVSVGGPTETTLWNIWHPVETVDPKWTSIPYGKPIANAEYFVLNEALEDCPTWVPGELYCAGVGLAKGYWRDPEKTEAQFITHPRTGDRLYKTGDLGRYWPDGTIEFLGRTDFRLKLRGHRMEAGEIEAALLQHSSIKAAVVRAIGETGDQQLVAYLVLDHPSVPLSSEQLADELRAMLRQTLPEYMVPTAYVVLDAFPLTPNGKVDRLNLPAPERSPISPLQSIPGSDLEQQIAAVWQEILQLATVGIDDNFFELGGSSILMVKAQVKLQDQLQQAISIVDMFRYPTVSSLAQHLDRTLSQSAPPIEPRKDSDRSRKNQQTQKRSRRLHRSGLQIDPGM